MLEKTGFVKAKKLAKIKIFTSKISLFINTKCFCVILDGQFALENGFSRSFKKCNLIFGV